MNTDDVCLFILYILQNANRSLRQKDGEVKETQTKISFLTEELSRLKKHVESSQVLLSILPSE